MAPRQMTLAGAVPERGEAGALAPVHGRAAGDQRAPPAARRSAGTLDVIIDEIDEDGALGRSKGDAPEIDGSVFVDGGEALKVGEIVRVRIDEADEYDLYGSLVDH